MSQKAFLSTLLVSLSKRCSRTRDARDQSGTVEGKSSPLDLNILNDLKFVLLSNLAETCEDTGQLTDVEQVMKLGWSWVQALAYCFLNIDCCFNQKGLHIDHVLRVTLRCNQGAKHETVNVSNKLLAWRCYKKNSRLFVQKLEALVINELSCDFECDLITPVVNDGQAEIIQKYGELFVVGGTQILACLRSISDSIESLKFPGWVAEEKLIRLNNILSESNLFEQMIATLVSTVTEPLTKGVFFNHSHGDLCDG